MVRRRRRLPHPPRGGAGRGAASKAGRARGAPRPRRAPDAGPLPRRRRRRRPPPPAPSPAPPERLEGGDPRRRAPRGRGGSLRTSSSSAPRRAQDDAPPEAPLLEDRAPVHVYVKTLEVWGRVAEAQRRLELPAGAVGRIPPEPVDAPGLLVAVEHVREALAAVAAHAGVEPGAVPAGAEPGAAPTPSALYRRLAHASVLLDALAGGPLSSGDVHRQALAALGEVAAIAGALGVTLDPRGAAGEGTEAPARRRAAAPARALQGGQPASTPAHGRVAGAFPEPRTREPAGEPRPAQPPAGRACAHRLASRRRRGAARTARAGGGRKRRRRVRRSASHRAHPRPARRGPRPSEARTPRTDTHTPKAQRTQGRRTPWPRNRTASPAP